MEDTLYLHSFLFCLVWHMVPFSFPRGQGMEQHVIHISFSHVEPGFIVFGCFLACVDRKCVHPTPKHLADRHGLGLSWSSGPATHAAQPATGRFSRGMAAATSAKSRLAPGAAGTAGCVKPKVNSSMTWQDSHDSTAYRILNNYV